MNLDRSEPGLGERRQMVRGGQLVLDAERLRRFIAAGAQRFYSARQMLRANQDVEVGDLAESDIPVKGADQVRAFEHDHRCTRCGESADDLPKFCKKAEIAKGCLSIRLLERFQSSSW